MKDYLKFLESKRHSTEDFGFDANYIPDIAFDFQKHIIEKAIKKGRIAIFADTGLGKTLIQLSIAKNIINHTNKNVLILTPLAVAFQFIIEAKKLGIDGNSNNKDVSNPKPSGQNKSNKIKILELPKGECLKTKTDIFISAVYVEKHKLNKYVDMTNKANKKGKDYFKFKGESDSIKLL